MDWQLAWDSLGPLLLGAVRGTIPLSLASFALGMVLAVALALGRMSPIVPLALASRWVISLVRGTPLLVQLFVIFYGLPLIGLEFDPWPSAIVAFSVNVGAYAAEIVRAAIQSVPAGQWEAGHTIGMSRAVTLRRIILPQAARVSVPPLSNTFISLIKDSSLASLILVTEMFRVGQRIAAFSQEFLVVYMEAALIYWVICLVLSTAQVRVERRLDRFVAHA